MKKDLFVREYTKAIQNGTAAIFAGAGFLVPLSGSLLMLPGHVKMPRCRDDYTLK